MRFAAYTIDESETRSIRVKLNCFASFLPCREGAFRFRAMPTYEYACSACGHKFERFESITAKPNSTCVKCSKKKAERQISGGGGLLFKGSGFYITDYKKPGGGHSPAAEPKSDSGSATKTETKSEAKTETKTETKAESKPKSSSKK